MWDLEHLRAFAGWGRLPSPDFSQSKHLEGHQESIAAGTHTRNSLLVTCFVVLISVVSPGKITVMHTLKDMLEREGGGSTTTLATRESPQIGPRRNHSGGVSTFRP